jgi:hypothetical protein
MPSLIILGLTIVLFGLVCFAVGYQRGRQSRAGELAAWQGIYANLISLYQQL